MSGERVVIAMSGGVDSSVAAALLLEQGYEVIGLMLRLWAEPGGEAENRCCTLTAVDDARRVAEILNIPFYLINAETPFQEQVVKYFVREYAAGRTPNPCLMCNRHIRFDLLLQRALALDARYLATGHYVRLRQADGRYRLFKGVDHSKDQSYVLYMLNQKNLAHLLFPLGGYAKKKVREMARARNLPVAGRPDSQDLCFLADGDYRRFLKEKIPNAVQPGEIVNRSGEVLGRHKGLPCYTIGQRRGLGIAAPEPLYVLEIDTERNALVVGTAAELGRSELTAGEVSFVAGKAPQQPLRVSAKIRYKAREAPALLRPLPDERAALYFEQPLRDITPGQGVVFYQGQELVGGGIIEN
ncbi:MAG: tRNA 2-thiouridine(34) synthase MnmA [Anaerolineaceae bacterium 4572_32.1]|nr:MAG: tRNA 2-thiouridine(34) synthase MnmA [Anaerolineaceae bacterium 4572_32.1]